MSCLTTITTNWKSQDFHLSLLCSKAWDSFLCFIIYFNVFNNVAIYDRISQNLVVLSQVKTMQQHNNTWNQSAVKQANKQNTKGQQNKLN